MISYSKTKPTLTSLERSAIEEAMQKPVPPSLRQELSFLFSGILAGAVTGSLMCGLIFLLENWVLREYSEQRFLTSLLVSALVVIGRFLHLKELLRIPAPEQELLRSMLATSEIVRQAVRARRIATLQTPPSGTDVAWMFAELQDGRILSVGGSGPPHLDQHVRPCRDFELVTALALRMHAFFHAQSDPDVPDLVLQPDSWDPLAVPAGTLLEARWDDLPELVRWAVARREASRATA